MPDGLMAMYILATYSMTTVLLLIFFFGPKHLNDGLAAQVKLSFFSSWKINLYTRFLLLNNHGEKNAKDLNEYSSSTGRHFWMVWVRRLGLGPFYSSFQALFRSHWFLKNPFSKNGANDWIVKMLFCNFSPMVSNEWKQIMLIVIIA
jgi:hypothetical protein